MILGLMGDGVNMGRNQSDHFDNAQSIWAQGSRWRRHRFALVCGLWQTSSCWKWTLTQGSRSVQQVTSPLFLMGPKKTNYESQLNICICRRVEIANHHSRLMRLSHSETPNHPKLFTSTPPRLILFGHNPDPIPLLIWLWLHMYMV